MRNFIFGVLLILIFSSFSKEKGFVSSQSIFEKINQLRRENNLPELKYNKLRQLDVNSWAKHLEEDFRHCNDGYQTENIAVAFEYDGLFNNWLNSPPHKKNFLNSKSVYCTIAVYKGKWKGREAFFGVYRGYTKKLKAR